LLADPAQFAELLRNALVVHAMLERKRRGERVRSAVVLPAGKSLRDLFPPERRRRTRIAVPTGPAIRRGDRHRGSRP
jgi:hypothetical protein